MAWVVAEVVGDDPVFAVELVVVDFSGCDVVVLQVESSDLSACLVDVAEWFFDEGDDVAIGFSGYFCP